MLRYVKNGMLLLSVAYIVIGMLLLIMPETSLLWICNIFGVVVLVTGIVCLIQYARIRGTGFTAPFMLVGGVITTGLGIFTLAKPQVVTSFLPVVFGIFIVVDGLSRIGTAIDLAKRKGQKWWMLLLFSIVSVALGVLLVLHPFDAAVSAVMLCGILLIAEGALNLGAAFSTPPWSCAHWTAWPLPPPMRPWVPSATPWTRPKPPSAMSAATALWCTTPRARMCRRTVNNRSVTP